MITLHSESIRLKPKSECRINLSEKTDSDVLLYSIIYNEVNEDKLIFAELNGEGSSKLISISLDKNKKSTSGEFARPNAHTDIFLRVDSIRLYSDTEIDFRLTIYKK
jgi:hypothetical protein